jgi:hypothetical protein
MAIPTIRLIEYNYLSKKQVGRCGMKVYPEYLPASIRNESQRAAEIFIYDLLTKIETGDHCAFYSKNWECLARVPGNQRLVDPLTGQVNPAGVIPWERSILLYSLRKVCWFLRLRVVEFQLKKGLGLAQIEMRYCTTFLILCHRQERVCLLSSTASE